MKNFRLEILTVRPVISVLYVLEIIAYVLSAAINVGKKGAWSVVRKFA